MSPRTLSWNFTTCNRPEKAVCPEPWPAILIKSVGTLGPSCNNRVGDPELILKLLSQTGCATPIEGPDEPVNWNYVATALRGIGSKGELEGLVAAQMVAPHGQAMEFLRRSVRQEQSNAGIDLNLNRAMKLLRMFATQLERLDHHRGKGGQKMVVEHVHIYKGGQACASPKLCTFAVSMTSGAAVRLAFR